MKSYPLNIQRIAGYQASIPYLGLVDMEDPIRELADESMTGKSRLMKSCMKREDHHIRLATTRL